ncbi:Jasmonate O-methyltransferase [Acorus gramineus]|uniref:Jasmonate O-methyltransferase n=1 Tax=Acorus gramineus TaxID=55184 RepID=A0AAV9BSK3_ACOGR|nr:Jasmonate O-methyltransferase [Acorus gramineus]
MVAFAALLYIITYHVKGQTTKGLFREEQREESLNMPSSDSAAMDVVKAFHMKEGVGETSYAQNSSLQMRVVDLMKHITLSTIADLYIARTPPHLAIADLGCSSGPNSLSLIKEIIESVDEACHRLDRPPPEFTVSLNDLPANDFNSMFLSLPEFYKKLNRGSQSVFIAGVPGSFYGRLFPSNSLDFIHSSLSVHWLSQVPKDLFDENGKCINKGNIYISPTSPPSVAKAYEKQFEEDFNLFLRLRSVELALGGRMVLIMAGRGSRDSWGNGITFLWDVLAQAFSIMVSLGKVEEEKVNRYKTHFYTPCVEEIKEVVEREGSFVMDKWEMFSTSEMLRRVDGRDTARSIKAIQESMMVDHFGEGVLIEELFELYGDLLQEKMQEAKFECFNMVVVLRKAA